MEAIQSGYVDYAVLPIENSSAGIVAENYDLLMEYDVTIVGEQIIKIDHALLGCQGGKDRGYYRGIFPSTSPDAVCGLSG